MRPNIRSIASVVLLLALETSAQSAATPEQQCEGGKNQVAGKYAACLGSARKTLVATADVDRYAAALAKCESKAALAWTKLETTAADAGAICPSSGDSTAIMDFLDGCAACVAEAAGGGDPCTPPQSCAAGLDFCEGWLAGCEWELAACEAMQAIPSASGQTDCWSVAGASIPCAGTGQDGEAPTGYPASFTNNGNGTITDGRTGLMWELLTDDGTIHDWNNTYTWAAAFTKVNDLNTAVFGGHSDWRVPNVREVQSLVDFGRTAPTIDPVFSSGFVVGCGPASCSLTQSGLYWTSTSVQTSPSFHWAWYVSFGAGSTDGHATNKSLPRFVRAVRSGV
ncbi:MAG: DUF1566 domain-containing protein [Candidatus Binatia bacterium]